MAKETEVKMEITIKTQGEKKKFAWDNFLSTIGQTRVINSTTISHRVIDLGVKANPERGEKQRLMNSYKRIIWSIIEGRYDIGSSLNENEIFIKFKLAGLDYKHRLTFTIIDGSLRAQVARLITENINSEIVFCLADPQSLDNLKAFIEFAITIIEQRNFSAQFLSSRTALISLNSNCGKHIYIESLGDKIKYTPLNNNMVSEFTIQTELHEKLSNDNLTILDGLCSTLHAYKHIEECITQMRAAGRTN